MFRSIRCSRVAASRCSSSSTSSSSTPPAIPPRLEFTPAELVRLAKKSDTHLRVLESRIESAEAHRAVLWQRLQSGQLSDERDLETTAEAYRRNTSDLLAMYREHKTKADSMLFTVLALFGGSVATLVGSAYSHWRSRREHELLGQRLEEKLSDSISTAIESAIDRNHQKNLTRDTEINTKNNNASSPATPIEPSNPAVSSGDPSSSAEVSAVADGEGNQTPSEDISHLPKTALWRSSPKQQAWRVASAAVSAALALVLLRW